MALASGGARGSAHVGVLKVLEREGIEVSAIAGSSIGSMVGGAYAAGVSVERIEQEWLNTNLPKVVRSFLPTFPRAGLSSGGELRKYLKSMFGDLRIEDLEIPFAAVACDLDTGETVVLREGPLVDALRASTAIPGIFFPVRWGRRILVDGGLVEPLPVRVCRELGAEIVIGVDIVPRPPADHPGGTAHLAPAGPAAGGGAQGPHLGAGEPGGAPGRARGGGDARGAAAPRAVHRDQPGGGHLPTGDPPAQAHPLAGGRPGAARASAGGKLPARGRGDPGRGAGHGGRPPRAPRPAFPGLTSLAFGTSMA
ncbi:patatin-like phospholipase family protein [Candidatus Bipolaricaulota bacterium]|nr:patatin-like phospholipase family protein [Candidatus Bipolaricaulota bacterium]